MTAENRISCAPSITIGLYISAISPLQPGHMLHLCLSPTVSGSILTDGFARVVSNTSLKQQLTKQNNFATAMWSLIIDRLYSVDIVCSGLRVLLSRSTNESIWKQIIYVQVAHKDSCPYHSTAFWFVDRATSRSKPKNSSMGRWQPRMTYSSRD